MKILVDIKKHKIVAPTKSELMNKLEGGYLNSRNVHRTYFTKAGHLINPGQRTIGARSVLLVKKNGVDFYRLYSLEKFNPKTRRTSRMITRGKRKGEIEKTIQVVREKHWTAHYVDYPASMVKDCIQYNHHYRVLLGI